MNTLLRIEAINLAFVIDDTEDLSTRRGGSTVLLEAIRHIERKFSSQLEPISTGASVGLFALKSSKSDELANNAANNAQQLLANVRAALKAPDKPYAHATFAVDLVFDANFHLAAEKAVTANRWRQMRELNFVTTWGSAKNVCHLDEIRPGTDKYGDPKPLSASVSARRQAGKKLRQALYQNILEQPVATDFTDNTQALSSFASGSFPPSPTIPPNLNGKMAVFYADGNRFGRIQRDCKNADALKAWDADIKQKRQTLLRELLAWLQQTPWAKTEDNELRFETLLWGGDELLFLLPAWLGLEFAEKFFALTADWEYQGSPLTHASGMVLAKHSSPISQLQKLAKHLAEHGKTESRKSQNTLAWVVLESFDHAGDQIEHFWVRNGIAQNGWDKLLLDNKRLEILRTIPALKEALPRSAMVRALRTLASGHQIEERELLQNTYRSTEQALTPEQRETLQSLWQAFGATWSSELPTGDDLASWAQSQAVPWSALIELWDYLLPAAPISATPLEQAA